LRLPPTVDPGPGEIQHVTTPGRNYMETLAAAGAWIASPADLVAIFDSLDPELPGPKPLPLDLLAEMLRPVGGQPGQRGYGLGVILYGPNRYGHTGTIESTRAMVQHRGDGVTWAVTVAGSYPGDTPQIERFVNAAFEAAGFVSSA
jgi:D-alanyl-D-alanine carboxypeptidase